MLDILKKLVPQTWNDTLGLLILFILGVIMLVLVILQPDMRQEVFVLVGPWGTLVIQFYFRKKEGES